MRNTLVALTLAALAACQPSQELTEDQRLALVDSVLQVQGDMIDAARAVDAERFLGFFAPDAGIVIDGVVVPREQFVANMRTGYQQLDRQEIRWHPAHVAVISRDIVILTIGGRYRAVSSTGETVSSGSATWTEVFQRHAEGWKLAYAHQAPAPGGSGN